MIRRQQPVSSPVLAVRKEAAEAEIWRLITDADGGRDDGQSFA
jgi:hypothetical protein